MKWVGLRELPSRPSDISPGTEGRSWGSAGEAERRVEPRNVLLL